MPPGGEVVLRFGANTPIADRRVRPEPFRPNRTTRVLFWERISDVSDQDRFDLLRHCGLIPLGAVRSAELPSAHRAWRVTASGNLERPTATVPLADEHLSARVDTEWLRLARQYAVIDRQDTFLIAPTGPPLFWTRVTLTDHARLAEHLVGRGARAGHAEFVTMAPDGSAMCGVTTEEYDVWLVADTERLHARPDPVEPNPTTLNPMQVDLQFSPDRLRHPYRDGVVLLGFHRELRCLLRLHELPECIAETPTTPLLAERPERDGALVPLTDEKAQALGTALDVPIDTERLAYYLEHQTGIVKSDQTTARRLPS